MIHTHKDPAAVETFELDWSLEISEDNIASSVWSTPTGITLGEQSNTATTASALIGGGVIGKIYRVANTITTVSGQVKVTHIAITIETT
jgi:hypothetical protein